MIGDELKESKADKLEPRDQLKAATITQGKGGDSERAVVPEVGTGFDPEHSLAGEP